jgi:hypothetical protein
VNCPGFHACKNDCPSLVLGKTSSRPTSHNRPRPKTSIELNEGLGVTWSGGKSAIRWNSSFPLSFLQTTHFCKMLFTRRLQPTTQNPLDLTVLSVISLPWWYTFSWRW